MNRTDNLSIRHASASGKPAISIIVPIYNAETYIPKCLNNLLDQTLIEIEILCIDDGSRDTSLKILQAYAAKDNRIQVFTQENQGPSVARNKGLDHAAAPFLMFCDVDDWYAPTMCRDMLKTLESHNVDLVMCDVEIIEEDQNHHRSNKDIAYHKLKLFGYLVLDNQVKSQINSLLWNKIFKRDLIERYNIRFPEGYEREDGAFILQYLGVAKTFFGLNKKLYNYLLRNASLMGQIYSNQTPQRVFDVIYVLKPAVEFMIANNILAENDFILCSIEEQSHWLRILPEKEDRIFFLQLLNDHVISLLDHAQTLNSPFLTACKNQNFEYALELLIGRKKRKKKFFTSTLLEKLTHKFS